MNPFPLFSMRYSMVYLCVHVSTCVSTCTDLFPTTRGRAFPHHIVPLCSGVQSRRVTLVHVINTYIRRKDRAKNPGVPYVIAIQRFTHHRNNLMGRNVCHYGILS